MAIIAIMRNLLAITAILLLAQSPAWASDTPAEPADPVGRIALALRYEHAEGVPKDLAKAMSLYCQAAKAGHAEGQFKLGWMYANARGVPRDDAVAAALFAMAAEQGHDYARAMLQYVRPRPETPLPSCLLPDPKPEFAESDALELESAGGPLQREMALMVRKLASQHGVDPGLALAITKVESGFNPRAVSPKNAQGLMQLIPKTAERFGVRNAFDPEQNVRGGLAYLRWLLALFQGDVRLAVAAYNAGERAIERYRGVPPYAETRDYVRKVTSLYRRALHPFDPALAGPSPVTSLGKANP